MTGELEPRHVAAVDQGEALVADALSTYTDNYRELQSRVGDTKALLTLAAQISADAHRGARGMDGLASLAAVAIAQLAAKVDRDGNVLVGTLRMNSPTGPVWCHGCGQYVPHATAYRHTPYPFHWNDRGGGHDTQAKAYPSDERYDEPVDREGVSYTLPCGCGYNAAGVPCAVGIGCDGSHPVHNRGAVEQVEPWHGKASQEPAVTEAYLRSGARPRCSRCYGVGHYASDCTVGL